MTKLWLTKSVLYFPFEITDFIKLDQVKNDFVSQNNIFVEPYEELWKKILGTACYFLEVLGGFQLEFVSISQVINWRFFRIFKNCQNGTFLPVHENQKFFGPNTFIWSAKKVPFSDFIQNMSPAPSMCLFMWIKVDK